jgi:hypothetical protein
MEFNYPCRGCLADNPTPAMRVPIDRCVSNRATGCSRSGEEETTLVGDAIPHFAARRTGPRQAPVSAILSVDVTS